MSDKQPDEDIKIVRHNNLYAGYQKILVPIFWYENEEGRIIYDKEQMREEFEHALKLLKDGKKKT